MRCAFAAVLLVGCSSQYGAYFQIEGKSDFDQIELYFGEPATSDAFSTPTYGPLVGTVFDRRFTASDIASVSHATRSTTYYVPASDENASAGSYVIVVASKGGTPVGIGELFGFDAPSDAVYEYKIPLVGYANEVVERWGMQPGCIAWKRPMTPDRPLVTAIVHETDRDCDSLEKMADCNDFCPMGSTACNDSNSVCTTSVTGSCAIGCAVSGLCSPKVCIPPATCQCSSDNLVTQLTCGVDQTQDHTEVYLDKSDTGALCTTQFKLNPGASCATAALEWSDPRVSDGVTFTVSDNGIDCIVDVNVPPGGHLGDIHHILISFAGATNLSPRRSVLVGIQASGLQCRTPSYSIDNRGSLFDCR